MTHEPQEPTPEWPNVKADVLREAIIETDDPEKVVNLFSEDRAAIRLSTRIDGRKAVALQILPQGLHHQYSEKDLVALVEPELRRKLEAMAQ